MSILHLHDALHSRARPLVQPADDTFRRHEADDYDDGQGERDGVSFAALCSVAIIAVVVAVYEFVRRLRA